MRAVSVVKRQSALAGCWLRCLTQAATSLRGLVYLECGDQGIGRRGPPVLTPPDRATTHAWVCTPTQSAGRAASFRCWEGLVERRLGVDVQVVLKQGDQVGVREVVVGDLPQNVGVIYGGMSVGHLHVSPAFEGGEHHEEVGDAVALVLVVIAGRAPRLHGDRLARLANQLL